MCPNTSSSSDVEEEPSPLATTLSDPKQSFTAKYEAARLYIDSLAKPVGSLGTLEDWGARMAALQQTPTPKADVAACLIFAADHGVAKDKTDGGRNCSAYPQAVSRKVLEALDHGIAGASVLSKCNNVQLRVIDVGLAEDGLVNYEWSGNVVRSATSRIKGGTANFCTGNAMTEEEVNMCIAVGRDETSKMIDEMDADVIMFGEVGIGNTTTASALIAALTGANVATVCGSGASITRDGINDEIVARKIDIIKEALKYHRNTSSLLGNNPIQALSAVGGAEICSVVGGMMEASKRDVAILVDGFIVTTAAMIACMIDPMVCRVLLFSTKSTEKGQMIAIESITKMATANSIPVDGFIVKPALDMGLRMGEASGCITSVPLLRSACAIVSSLATLNDVLSLEMGK
jgi:nicotinate-nucleotide--dimethylbenzimidazole phosphoribosyltransferase